MFIRNRNFNGLVPYHDPVYDETGGQGAASTPAPVPVQDPTFLYMAIAVVVFLMLQED